MKTRVLISITVCMALTMAVMGCGSTPYAMSSHTLDVGPSQQTDVLWIVKRDRIMRCFTDAQGPICMTARGQ